MAEGSSSDAAAAVVEQNGGGQVVVDDTSNNHNNPDDLRQMGNHQFAQGEYGLAAQLYTQALEVLLGNDYNVAASESSNIDLAMKEPPTSLLLNLCNRSACYYQMELYDQAKKDAEMAWNYFPQLSNIKAAYRLAKTLIALEQFEEGKDVILQVFQILDEVGVEERKKAEREAAEKRHDITADPKQLDQETKEEEEEDDESIKTQRRAFNDLLKNLEKKQKNKGKEPPKLSIRDFALGDELGFGNFSEIYKVKHKKTGKEFALKRINKKKAADLG